jgi:hypothetical protein
MAGSSLAAFTVDRYLSTLESPMMCNFSIVRFNKCACRLLTS